MTRHICIPVEELEAWFWSDPATLKRIAKREVPASLRRYALHPHTLAGPKEELMKLSYRGGRTRHTTTANKDLAKDLDLTLCEARCQAFRDLAAFVRAPP